MSDLSAMELIGALLAGALLVYLFIALLIPERLQ